MKYFIQLLVYSQIDVFDYFESFVKIMSTPYIDIPYLQCFLPFVRGERAWWRCTPQNQLTKEGKGDVNWSLEYCFKVLVLLGV